MIYTWSLGLSLVLMSFSAAFAGIGALVLFTRRRPWPARTVFSENVGGTVFLFDGETLVDASPGARALLASGSMRGSAWQRLMAYLVPRFPTFGTRILSLPTEGRFVINSGDGSPHNPLTLLAEWRGGLARISLAHAAHDHAINLVDPVAQRAMEEELAMLRGTVAQAPFPIWLENAQAEVVWANTFFLNLVTQRLGPEEDLTWPLPRLMSVNGSNRQRVCLESAGEPTLWFETTMRPAGDGHMIFGTPVDGLVQAEAALRDFVQTLTKTFAHLPIGLAIFDRARQLTLFNPALLDLTGLPPEFLIARPRLFDFLDRMRDRQMIPEPKDYPSWRSRIVDLEEAAASGLYEETWNLPGGHTYRVLGRPHPDGALALLFEDISTEMSRTRRYRADVELGQSVIDAMDEAVAVFSSTGNLVLSNAAYADLWGSEPVLSLGGEAGIGTMATLWRNKTAPSPIWSEAEDFVSTLGERSAWSDEARLNDGRLLSCRFLPLSGGSTMIAFRAVSTEAGTTPGFVSSRARLRA